MVIFSARLKQLRLEKKLYQKELADAVGLSRATITAYESGKREPDQATLDRIASFFEVSVDYLLGRTDIRNTAREYSPPRELDDVLRETDITFNGSPLNHQDKEYIIEFIQVALKAMQKRSKEDNENEDR